MTITLTGTGVSRGTVIGKVHRLDREEVEIYEITIPIALIEDEVSRFQQAIHLARQQLKAIRNSIPEATSPDISGFIDTHLLMLEDSMITTTPVDLIRRNLCNAEWALKSQRDALARVFDEMHDPYLRTRKDDIDHVVNRIQRILRDNDNENEPPLIDKRLIGAVVFARELTPADTVVLQHQGITGFVTESGGPLSHTAILARSLGLPAIVGARNIPPQIREGDLVVVDGARGIVITDPDEDTLEQYRKQQRAEQQRRTELNRLKDDATVSIDNRTISLLANIELREDVRAARRVRATGIGLYRTEFMFMNREDVPDEEEQLEQYLAVVKSLRGIPLTIRTLDLGADKRSIANSFDENSSTNPALGLRAIRLCLKNPELFHPQLRAILRASAKGPVRLMVPMLSSMRELADVLNIIEEVKRSLHNDGLAYDPDIRIGGMIEVPAAALCAPSFAKKLDFLSIGTNDLIQYTLAIDRVDDEVTYLYDPLHPAVLRLIEIIIAAGTKFNVPVTMCGEMAGDTRYTRLLLGMGLTDFSVPPTALLEVKEIIHRSDISLITPLVDQLLEMEEPADIATQLEMLNHL